MKLVVIAGEASGDALGAGVIEALRGHTTLYLSGVGGESMKQQGLTSLFPYQELSLIGFSAVMKQLPHLLRRVREIAAHIITTNPDCVLLIDAQDFCDRVAKIVRKNAPHIRLVKYVCPTVWAWREGRAAKLVPLYDEILAVFPFEPLFMQRLKSVITTYVGHPLMDKLKNFQELEKTHALLLPGSRRSEIAHHLPLFMQYIQTAPHTWLMPIVPHLKELVQSIIKPFAIQPHLIESEDAKWKAFAGAQFALAASGTVSLELALCNVPHVAVYKGGAIEAFIMQKMVNIPSILLPNIILNETIVPQLLQNDFTLENLTRAVSSIDLPAQQTAFTRLKAIMYTGENASEVAAARLLELTASKPYLYQKDRLGG